MARDFLNSGILGANAGNASKRGFRTLNTDSLPPIDYDGRFIETFPTAWASAHAFRKEIEAGHPSSIDEWATLFLLHYFGVITIRSFNQETIQKQLDRDLWAAFAGTYPKLRSEGGLMAISVLETSDKMVVGACYPETIFFAGRGREGWAASEVLKPYLTAGKLSWAKAESRLISDNFYRQEFNSHLRGVINILPIRRLKERIEQFCNQHLGALNIPVKYLSSNPTEWVTRVRDDIDPQQLLGAYPLKNKNEQGGVTYYILTGLNLSQQDSWMTKKISPDLPSPVDYSIAADRKIGIEFAGNKYLSEIGGLDEVVLIKDLLLDRPVAFCKVQLDAGRFPDDFACRISNRHLIALQDSSLQPNERAMCLAPVTQKFFQYFSETLSDAKSITSEASPEGSVVWTLNLRGVDGNYPIKFSQSLLQFADLAKMSSIAMYPPKVSPQWKLYAAFGTGNRQTTGIWSLIDENGGIGRHIQLEDDEYISVLSAENNQPNRPRALLLKDDGGNERGVAILSDFDSLDMDPGNTATLAVDFGTSNTCLAIKTQTSEVVKFSLTPEMLWGPITTAEAPGFVPKNWGGQRGFFPTILLSRRSDGLLPNVEPENVTLEHLFKTDIPGLHKGFNNQFAAGGFEKNWRTHPDLKWGDDDKNEPWRTLFLEQILFYAHAEVFFNKQGKKIDGYKFTYPLAFSSKYGNSYHERAREAVRKIRHYCYGDSRTAQPRYESVDESTAVASSILGSGTKGALDVFVDIGGGTADIAIRHDNEFLVLDSLRVAGKTFFHFARKNFDPNTKLAGAADFRKNLNYIVRKKDDDLDLSSINGALADDLGSFYAVEVNELDERMFQEREEAVLQKRMGMVSYQRYRSKLFFHHLLTYALLQACATVVDQKIDLSNGIRLILGGNGWGLLLFAEMERRSSVLLRDAKDILKPLKAFLANSVSDEERILLDRIDITSLILLNEESLSKAKTSVAVGALADPEKNRSVSDTAPYSGISVPNFQINSSEPASIRWCDRWSYDAFRERFGRFDTITSKEFEQPRELKEPIDKALEIFTAVGNSSSFGVDNSPQGMWMALNSLVVKSISEKLQTEGERLNLVPLNHFLSEILYPKDTVNDLLDSLADANLNGNNGGQNQ